MAIVTPFRGLTYNYHQIKDISNLVAPPYDVISEEEQNILYRADLHNVIRLTLGKKRTGDTDWDNRYTRAADYFDRWRSDGILIQSSQPSFYLNSLTYQIEDTGMERTRWGLIALVRLEDWDSGVIVPHERTFSAHKDDRLKLMRACNAQFSPIFGLYEDPENIIMDICRAAAHFTPQVAFQFSDQTKHKFWILQDPTIFKKVMDAMKSKTIFIADGHHRYETSLNYRNLMRVRYGHRRSNRSYEYVMMYLSNLSDEGLTILPSHQLIKMAPGFDLQSFMGRIGNWFNITDIPFPQSDNAENIKALKQLLENKGNQNTAIGFLCRNADRCYLLSLKSDAPASIDSGLHPSLKKLDVIILSALVLQKGLGFNEMDLDNEEIFHFQSSIKTVIEQVQSGAYQMAFFLNPTKIEQMKEITYNALVMPRKSTFFYPKILTGLVFHKIDPYESILIP
jgi:uncharacterized protein (DUF1015 family)